MKDLKECIPFAKTCCSYLTASPDPYHAVQNSVNKLKEAGYVQLSRREPFTGKLTPGGKYYYTVNSTALVAFVVGKQYVPGNGFKIIGGHTDSPNLKVKPLSKRTMGGYTQLGVECYGGGLWHTWLDRDLGISGRVLVRTTNEQGKEVIEQKLILITEPVARVSSLCIHLQTAEERSALKLNKEEHMSPILGTQTVLEEAVKEQLEGSSADNDPWKKGQEPALLRLIASKLDINVESIADFELNLFDTQPASLGGIESEFLNSGRLDNLATCFVSTEGLIAHSSSDLLETDEDISMMCLFDHEEVGSSSAQGAASPLVSEAVQRVNAAMGTDPSGLHPDLYAASICKSFLFSVDQAHAQHPNYMGKHEKNHAPRMNAGVVVKSNSNQRYCTNAATGFLIRELTRKAGITPLQEFVVRNDCPCGSTIGPILSSKTGIRTVDAGMPQLSMHSCREVMGIVDLTNCYELFLAFFKHFREVDVCLEC